MKKINKILNISFTILLLSFISCSNEEEEEQEIVVSEPLKSEQVTNFAAPQTGGMGQPIGGEFSKFDFVTGEKSASETEWDIAFRGTTICINGGTSTGTADEPVRNGNAGAVVVSGTFDSVTTVQGLTFSQDAEGSFAIPTGSDNGWYNYNPQTFTITPIPGKVLVFRTRDGRYAKVEILSYYLDQDSSNTRGGRYYTFNYVFNPNQGETSF